jgi:23S rRNA pseudouridine1911/1915/1917 synthase
MADPLDGAIGTPLELTVTGGEAGLRLDKALALLAADRPGLSRSRIAQLIAAGMVTDDAGETVTEVRRKVKPGEVYLVQIPPPLPIEPEPEAIALEIVHEDADLIVIDKPAGMVVHPAPGAERGTVVNALLRHCGTSLGGIGGALRPGIVHRIDKDTSGLLVVAKTEAAHAGLAALFAAHEVTRRYLALAWGAPDRADPRLAGLAGVGFEPGGWVRIEAPIARRPTDRKRMAVVAGGRRAVTRLRASAAKNRSPACSNAGWKLAEPTKLGYIVRISVMG